MTAQERENGLWLGGSSRGNRMWLRSGGILEAELARRADGWDMMRDCPR